MMYNKKMKEYRFATRMDGIEPSQTLQMASKAKQLVAQGVDVIDLSVGEPDFPTPKFITDAAKRAIDAGLTSFYTPTLGLLELRKAIACSYQSRFALGFQNVGITTGAKLSLACLMQILISDGEKVVIPAPYWVSYGEQIKLALGSVYSVYPKNAAMKLTIQELSELDFLPKAVLINNPTNPTGSVYSKEELEELIDWAEINDVFLIVDEIYNKLVYNGTKFTSALELASVKDSQLIVVDGVSKAYSMTGWRLGWTVADEKIIAKLGMLLDHLTSNPTAISQYAALEALNSDGQTTEQMRKTFEDRLNFATNTLEKIQGLTLLEKPQGAFYLFVKVDPDILKRKGFKDTNELVLDLLEQKHVAIPSGEAFGLPGYIRISYAKDKSTIKEGMKRIEEYLSHD